MPYDWETVTTYRDPRFLVKGVELAFTVCGAQMRFAICEHRAMTAEGEPSVIYRVRDAETVSDAEVKHGLRPKVVARFHTFEEAETFVRMAGLPPNASMGDMLRSARNA